MHLYDLWFIAIAVLWIGYFFLEGFDFGVGVLTRFLARDERERRVMINTIGPVWDGNEVWFITAGGATFAAFPEWYATLFSGFYIPLLIILVALIFRAIAFDYRGKGHTDRWRANWDRAIFWGSLVPAFLWGVAFANIVRGVKLNENHDYVGSFWDLLNPYALLGGVVTLVLFTFHGAVFTALKTDGEIRARANRFSIGIGVAALVLAGVFLLWTLLHRSDGWTVVAAVLAAVFLAAAILVSLRVREGWAFLLSGLAIVFAVATLFLSLYPYVMPSTIAEASNSLTVQNASSTAKTLGIMTWVAGIFLPIVLIYQGWTYWVFRKRIHVDQIPAAEPATHPATS
ncbi:cytochrome bd-I ubiquinol oxidase subunit 2 apoprotein [Actinocorallia herbida]|uniref:Cytochrome bd-I ubiquinol oxidase subunit 2 apoprotein n=1 Tax=Actinocorallia herbida TaxID=58109 RepID=A0A3N1CR46_9ACTN|nr:cytochrome d ubiquinol oxidase subunit II [Actinocorallia herbida]ROO83178.1 cytochrome bd-I ubiquinol oxidase subunit 2 apoprotein [Actinocorallia herbida]